MNTVPAIEFWFDFSSPYSYLSVMRIGEAAARRGLAVDWRPFLLGPVFRRLGWETSPLLVEKERGAYMWKDMARQCGKYGLAWVRPTVFPRRALVPMRIACLGAREAWIGAFCRRVMELNFAEDREIDDEAAMAEVLGALNLPAATLLAEAQSEENKLRLREQTDRAISLGIFGAPTFFVGEEMFWGNDRLDDALLAHTPG